MKRTRSPALVAGDGTGQPLEKLPLETRGLYSEDWIQGIVHVTPDILPIGDIEPGFAPAIPICRELPLPSGSLDNLLITPSGDLILVECKLWRNPQARREVIAQVIDYAKDLQTLDYEALEANIGVARGERDFRLFDAVEGDLDEAAFIDGVSRNLARGRALLLVVGDGITEQVERIGEYLQQHPGAHFTLALVELGLYRLPDGQVLVVPSVPLRTTNVVRGVISIEGGTAAVAAPPAPTGDERARARNLTEEEFFADLDAIRPGTSGALMDLLVRVREMGGTYTIKRALMIKMPIGEGEEARVAWIPSTGEYDVSFLGWLTPTLGLDAVEAACGILAKAIPGAEVYRTPKGYGIRAVTVWDVLDHREAWLRAIRTVADRLADRLAALRE